MENKEWLESLKPGDEVCLNMTHGGVVIRKVERLTKTQIILDISGKFRRDTGRYYKSYISEVTDYVKLKIKTENLIYKISKINFRSLPIDKIERILTIVGEEENDNK